MGRQKREVFPPPPTKRRRSWLAVLALLALLAFADYWLYPLYGLRGELPLRTGPNGIWLRYTWYFGEKSDEEIRALAKRLEDHAIYYGYFHVRSIKADGTLRFRYPEQARRLNRIVSRAHPTLNRVAWIFAGNGKHGDVDLSNAKVRAAMVKEAVWLVNECGFQGVQWDYEVCPDKDPYFLKLLRETRAALPEGAFIGVAAPMWFPLPGLGWCDEYFFEVSVLCDQIAIMCYDSGFYFPRAYVWLVSEQPYRLGQAITPDCSLVFGLPTYEDGPPSHNAHAENLRHALWGIRKALNRDNIRQVGSGVAIFADYTTDEEEWQTFRDLWPPGHGGG